jgi:NDP-sugar pyrophosphorylase family protein
LIFTGPYLGIRDAVQEALQKVEKTIAVYNGDEVRMGFDLQRLLEFHRQGRWLASTVLTEVDNLAHHFPCHIDHCGKVKYDSKPKEFYQANPKIRGLVNAGIMLLEPEAAFYFDKSENNWSGIFKPLIAQGKLGADVDSNILFYNINTPEDYRKAQIFFEENNDNYLSL